MTIELLVLRLVHVLGGIFWVGSAIFMTFFLAPALAGLGPTGGQIFGALQKRGLPMRMMIAAVLTILSGLRLMWLVSGGYSSAWFATPPGRGYVVAATSAIVALLIGLFVGRPAAARGGQIAAEMAMAPADRRESLAAEAARLRRRSMVAGTVTTVLLVLAAAGMAVARYLR